AAYEMVASSSPTAGSPHPLRTSCARESAAWSAARASGEQPSVKNSWSRPSLSPSAEKRDLPVRGGPRRGRDAPDSKVLPASVLIASLVRSRASPVFLSQRSLARDACDRRLALGEDPLHVVEQLFRLVPAIEDANAGRASSSAVGCDHDRDLGALRACGVGSPKRVCDSRATVENGAVDPRLKGRFRQPARGRQLFDFELASLEEEPGELREARITTRHQHPRSRLRHVLPRSLPWIDARVVGAPRRPRDTLTDLDPAALALTGCELDDLAGAATGHRPPGRRRARDVDHGLIRIQKHD